MFILFTKLTYSKQQSSLGHKYTLKMWWQAKSKTDEMIKSNETLIPSLRHSHILKSQP